MIGFVVLMKKIFPYSDIYTDWLVISFTPIIDIDEVSLF